MGTGEEVLALAALHGGRELCLGDDDDLLGAYGMEGDDASEFLEAFADWFGTDLDGLLWYFHYNGDEPPPARPRLYPVSPAGARLPLHRITLNDLVAAEETGRWHITYPPHELRERFAARLKRWLVYALIPVALAIPGWDVFRG